MPEARQHMPRNHRKPRPWNSGWRCAVLFSAALAAGATGDALPGETPQPASPAIAGGSQQAPRNSVQAIGYSLSSGGQIIVRVVFRHEPGERPPVFASYHAAAVHVVVDLADTASELGRKTVQVERYGLRRLHLVPAGTRTRLVIVAEPPLGYEAALKGRELLITLHRAETAVPRGGRWRRNADKARTPGTSYPSSFIPHPSSSRLSPLGSAPPGALPDARVAIGADAMQTSKLQKKYTE
ncbi:MAG: hypothetical protein HY525_16575 [Betaproteobacteria bacterium]|nr:hypothetical protein [Betaproteobacteria bacterium]